ncbi:hypothetical protein D3C80_766670 [compost metagenome]
MDNGSVVDHQVIDKNGVVIFHHRDHIYLMNCRRNNGRFGLVLFQNLDPGFDVVCLFKAEIAGGLQHQLLEILNYRADISLQNSFNLFNHSVVFRSFLLSFTRTFTLPDVVLQANFVGTFFNFIGRQIQSAGSERKQVADQIQ